MANFIWENLFNDDHKEKTLRQKLKTNFLFQDLAVNELKMLEKIVNIRTYRPGEIVFRQGDVGVGMYIISKGTVNIYKEEIVPESGNPRTTHITQLQEGDFFGDLALVEDNGRRSASAVAHQETNLIGFFKPDLIELANRNPTAGVKILMRLGEVLGSRLAQTTAKISELKNENKNEPKKEHKEKT
jgi:CRP-like cAMP-binding protein